jgi:hypothetical protein
MRISMPGRRGAALSTRSRRLPWYAGMVVAALTAACTAQGGAGRMVAGRPRGHARSRPCTGAAPYTQVANVDFTVGEALGLAEFPPCDDTPGHDDDAQGSEPATAYAVDGLNPRTAIAVRYTSDESNSLPSDPVAACLLRSGP